MHASRNIRSVFCGGWGVMITMLHYDDCCHFICCPVGSDGSELLLCFNREWPYSGRCSCWLSRSFQKICRHSCDSVQPFLCHPFIFIVFFFLTRLFSRCADEGVYVDLMGRQLRDVRLQWGEAPTSIGKLCQRKDFSFSTFLSLLKMETWASLFPSPSSSKILRNVLKHSSWLPSFCSSPPLSQRTLAKAVSWAGVWRPSRYGTSSQVSSTVCSCTNENRSFDSFASETTR